MDTVNTEFKGEYNHLSPMDWFLILEYAPYYKGSSVFGASFNSSEPVPFSNETMAVSDLLGKD